MNEKGKVVKEAKAEAHITQQALLTELKAAIGDLFVVNVKQAENELYLHFLNGQRFALTVKEL